jgi:hypothetical protein
LIIFLRQIPKFKGTIKIEYKQRKQKYKNTRASSLIFKIKFMQYKNTIEAIYISLEEVQKLISVMGAEQEIRAIDVDLAADKIRHIYDLLNNLKAESIQVSPEKVNAESKTNADELIYGAVEENVIEFDVEDENDSTEELYIHEHEAENKQNLPEQENNDEVHQKTQAEIDSRVKMPSGKKYLGESFEKKSSSLNEELSKKVKPSKITDQLTSKPIASIGAALGLNEKFEIINNLFDGNKEKYEHTMQVLNAASDFNEAYEYIANNLGWDLDNIYVQKILELIRRKLIVKKNDE